MALYIFDLDGTLTPPRQPMDPAFAAWFGQWLAGHRAYLATGADFRKVCQQVPPDVLERFQGVFHSMGNVLQKGSAVVYERRFDPPAGLVAMLEEFRRATAYPGPLFEGYIEYRPGLVNFSAVGRRCPQADRERYCAWDRESGERARQREAIMRAYPELEVTVSGSISVDIVPKGCGKGQIAHYLRRAFPTDEIVFFGDRTFPGGNDYLLACELAKYPGTRTIQAAGPAFVRQALEG